MPSSKLKNFLIIVMLGFLTASAFFIRLDNFSNSRLRSIDEIVYYHLGRQLKDDGFSNYHTIQYGKELMSQGRSLPDYFTKPLFKYPPLFSLMISQSMKTFGNTLAAAFYVPLLAGVLMIPIVYLLGTTIFDRKTGLIASCFLFIDPISIICSQKVWPETTLAFFTLLSILSFTGAVKNRNNIYFILSGLFCGFATLTKYPGVLLVIVYIFYASMYNKSLLRDKYFLTGITMPFIMLIPWGIWNYNVYGQGFLSLQLGLHSSVLHQRESFLKLTVMTCLIAVFYLLHIIMKKRDHEMQGSRTLITDRLNIKLRLIFASIFLVVLSAHIIRGLQFTYLPITSWAGIFYYEPPTFYFGRLLEFSLIYIFAYASFFIVDVDQNEGIRVLKLASVVLITFYIFWGNYQSRYILAVIPLLILLAAHVVTSLVAKASKIPNFFQRNLILLGLILMISHTVVKTIYLNQVLSYPNDLCYF